MLPHRKLIIRADASTQIGTGHVMRCLALAQAWQESGGDACFVFAFYVPALESRLQTEGMEVVHLNVSEPGSEKDAVATVVFARQYQVQWIVVDGYHFDADYQQRLKTAGFRVLFIDDFGHATHYFADIVLNQNIYADPEMYTHREPYTQLLLGTNYVLLRREFRAWRDWQRQMPEKARKILVTLGGSDPDNVTLTVIQALSQLPYDDLEAIVLVGAQNPHYQVLETAVADDTRIQLQSNVTNIPELMAWADLAVSAGGSTNWELAFMRLPTMIISLVENQSSIAQYLHDSETAVSIGWHTFVTGEKIKQEIVTLAESRSLREGMSHLARLLVDGCGAKRVSHIVSPLWFILRSVQEEDSALIWSWANDPMVRAVSFSKTEIPWESHIKWFEEKLNDSNCFFYIAFNLNHHPVGQVRYDVKGNEGVISVSLAPEFRGCGYGTQLIQQATKMFLSQSQVEMVIAHIEEQNIASIRAFTKAGFQEIDPIIVNGICAKRFLMPRNRGVIISCS